MKRALGTCSRFINGLIPGGIPGESCCGRAARVLGPESFLCALLDTVLGIGHCEEERDFALKGLRKK